MLYAFNVCFIYSRFYYWSNHYESWSECSLSLIWFILSEANTMNLHQSDLGYRLWTLIRLFPWEQSDLGYIVCNIGYETWSVWSGLYCLQYRLWNLIRLIWVILFAIYAMNLDQTVPLGSVWSGLYCLKYRLLKNLLIINEYIFSATTFQFISACWMRTQAFS